MGFQSVFATENDIDEDILLSKIPSELKDKILKDLKGKKSIDIITTHKIYNKKGDIIGEESFDLQKENLLERIKFLILQDLFSTLY